MSRITLLSFLVYLSFSGCSKSSSTPAEPPTPTTGTILLITSSEGTWYLNDASDKKIDSLTVTYSTVNAKFINVNPGTYRATWKFTYTGFIAGTSPQFFVEAGKTTDVTFTYVSISQSIGWKIVGPR